MLIYFYKHQNISIYYFNNNQLKLVQSSKIVYLLNNILRVAKYNK